MTISRPLMRLLLALIMLVGNRSALAQTPDHYPWTTSEIVNVTKAVWTNAQISSFITAITGGDPDYPVRVGDFRFVDILGDGNIQLLASADYSGRALFNTLLVVRKDTAAFSIQSIRTYHLEDLSAVVADLNGDGKQELLIPTALTSYISGPFPRAQWIAVYSWLGSIFVESSANFADYYRTSILPPLQRGLDDTKVANDPVLTALAQLEYDKSFRIATGGRSEFGITTAQQLANSADPNLRIWAADVLADIGSPAALQILAKLALDPDPRVAGDAQSIQSEAVLNRCERIPIIIQDTINLGSKKLIRVTVPVTSRRGAERQAVDVTTMTLSGGGGDLVSCNDGGKEGMICLFRAEHTMLQLGDGVATLTGSFRDGTCVIGQGAVQIVNIPQDR